MAWWPMTESTRRRTRLAAKRKVREVRRWMRTREAVTGAMLATMTAVCILLLGVGDTSSGTDGLGLRDGQLSMGYWTVRDGSYLARSSYPPPAAVDAFIAGCVRYIIRASKLGSKMGVGRFAYHYSLADDGSVSESDQYNTLRHSGTAYALADACYPLGAEEGDETPRYCAGARETLARAADWLMGTAAPMGETGALGLWSRPEDERPGEENAKKAEVRAGGIGLGLVALTAGLKAGSASVNDSVLRDVARAATDVLQQDNGAMASYYVKKVIKRKQNPFYAGEAALGMIRLYKMNGNVTLRDAAVRALRAIAHADHSQKRQGKRRVCDHWALIATGNLLRDSAYVTQADEDARIRHERAQLLRHARRVMRGCHARDAERTKHSVVGANSFGSAVEAQLNVLVPLAEAGDKDGSVGIGEREAVEVFCQTKRTLGAAMSMQLHDDAHTEFGSLLEGAVSGNGVVERPKEARRIWRVRTLLNGEFQIDTTQHTLSAALAYVRVAAHPLFRRVRCQHPNTLVDPHGLAVRIMSD